MLRRHVGCVLDSKSHGLILGVIPELLCGCFVGLDEEVNSFSSKHKSVGLKINEGSDFKQSPMSRHESLHHCHPELSDQRRSLPNDFESWVLQFSLTR